MRFLFNGGDAGGLVVLLHVGLGSFFEGAGFTDGQVQIVLEVVLVGLLLGQVQLRQEFR